MSAVNFSFQVFGERMLSRLLSALFVVLMASALHAQIVEVGTITGVVKDNSGALVPNAHVTVQNIGTGITANSTTDSQGIFVAPSLRAGDYNVIVEAPGGSISHLHNVLS